MDTALPRVGALIASVDALRNWRAALLVIAVHLATLAVFALAASLARGSAALATMVGVLGVAVLFYGLNAVGLMMMDEARGLAARPPVAALSAALFGAHRLLLVFVLLAAVYVVGTLATAAVLLLCKLPLVGPLLYVVAFPVGVVVWGVALLAIPTVLVPLSAPAVWSGAGTRDCVVQVAAIARRRLPTVVLLMLGVGFIAATVGLLLFAVLLAGAGFMGTMSVGILPAAGTSSLGLAGGLMAGVMGADWSVGGHAAAAAAGGAALLALAASLPLLVYLRGASTVYLQALQGLDLQAEQAALAERMSAAKARARALHAQARATAQPYAQRPAAAAAGQAPSDIAGDAGTAGSTDASLACPACGQPVGAADAFCGHCGHRQRAGRP